MVSAGSLTNSLQMRSPPTGALLCNADSCLPTRPGAEGFVSESHLVPDRPHRTRPAELRPDTSALGSSVQTCHVSAFHTHVSSGLEPAPHPPSGATKCCPKPSSPAGRRFTVSPRRVPSTVIESGRTWTAASLARQCAFSICKGLSLPLAYVQDVAAMNVRTGYACLDLLLYATAKTPPWSKYSTRNNPM